MVKERYPPGMTMISVGAVLFLAGLILLALIANGTIGNNPILPPVITPLRMAVGGITLGALFFSTGIYVRRKLLELHKQVCKLEEEKAKLREKLKEEKVEAREAKEIIKEVSQKVKEISQRLKKK